MSVGEHQVVLSVRGAGLLAWAPHSMKTSPWDVVHSLSITALTSLCHPRVACDPGFPRATVSVVLMRSTPCSAHLSKNPCMGCRNDGYDF